MINNEYTGCTFKEGGTPYIQLVNSAVTELSSKVLSTVTPKIAGTSSGQGTLAVSFLLEAGDVLSMSAHWNPSVSSGIIIAKVCVYY